MLHRSKAANVTESARADIRKIKKFTSENWGCEQQRTYLEKLSALISAIGVNPRMGQLAPELGEGYRKVAYRQYWIIYKVRDHRAYIHRILHGSRDLERHLEKNRKQSKERGRSR